jgi:hypothetical protein
MDVDVAAEILAGCVLTGLSFLVIVVTIVAINNILHKYWKPVKMFTPDSWRAFNPPTHDFASQEELERVKSTKGKDNLQP